jgi:hypothetical protein
MGSPCGWIGHVFDTCIVICIGLSFILRRHVCNIWDSSSLHVLAVLDCGRSSHDYFIPFGWVLMFVRLLADLKHSLLYWMKEVITDLSGVTSKSTLNFRITRLWDTWNINKRNGMINTNTVLLMDEKVFLIALIKVLLIPKQLLCWPPNFNFFF